MGRVPRIPWSALCQCKVVFFWEGVSGISATHLSSFTQTCIFPFHHSWGYYILRMTFVCCFHLENVKVSGTLRGHLIYSVFSICADTSYLHTFLVKVLVCTYGRNLPDIMIFGTLGFESTVDLWPNWQILILFCSWLWNSGVYAYFPYKEWRILSDVQKSEVTFLLAPMATWRQLQ